MEHPAFALMDEEVEEHVPGRLDEEMLGPNQVSAQKTAALREARVGERERPGMPLSMSIRTLQRERKGAASGRIIHDYP